MSSSSLPVALNAICEPTHKGHWYEILHSPRCLMATLSWRKSSTSGETVSLEKLYKTDMPKYEEALRVMQDTGSYDCFEGNDKR